MIEVTRYELEVFKERLAYLCRDMDVTLMVDGFDFEFSICRGFNEYETNGSLNHLIRSSNDHNY